MILIVSGEVFGSGTDGHFQLGISHEAAVI